MRRMMLAVSLVVVFAVDASADEADVKDVEKALGALNEAFEKGNADAIKRLQAEDHLAVTSYYGGPLTRAEQIATLKDLKLTEYKTGKMTIKQLGKDVVQVTYTVTMNGTFKGKEVVGPAYASAIWVKRDGKWQEVFYQETVLGGK